VLAFIPVLLPALSDTEGMKSRGCCVRCAHGFLFCCQRSVRYAGWDVKCKS
jgi:hypothetical protein